MNVNGLWKFGRALWLVLGILFLAWPGSSSVEAAGCVVCTNVTVMGQSVPGCKGVDGAGYALCAFVGDQCLPGDPCGKEIQ